ncbi:desulfoferrodoxin FeS4 iron-binding domain-containing protein [Chloroflexota bacterium]
MAVEKLGETYKCNVCSNEVIVIKVGGGTLICCGQYMERIKEGPPEVINLPDAGG